jgi:hypothetical protein
MMRRSTHGLLLSVYLITFAAPLAALEWPVADPHPVRVFGQRAFGVAERGVVFEKAETIRASGYGELLVTLGENRNMSGFPGTLGNAVVLAHDDGLMTVYGNLDSLDRVADRAEVDSLAILGNAGSSAWGEQASAIFQVGDREKRTKLNPLLVLPPLPDKKGPSIRDVIAVAANGTVHTLGTAKSMRQGKYRVYADIIDSIEKNPHDFAPFRVTVQVNGKEYSSIPFELLSEKNGELFLSDPQFTWNKLYSDPARIYLGELSLTRGRADISIIARDIAGNERAVMFGLQIE